MAVENIVKGKKLRILVDAVNNVWDRISFWTAASDVYMDDNSNLQNKIGNSALNTTNQTITGAITEVNTKVIPLRKTLGRNATSITFTDSRINPSSLIDVYCSIWGVVPESITVSNGSCTIRFEAQSSDMSVGLMFFN